MLLKLAIVLAVIVVASAADAVLARATGVSENLRGIPTLVYRVGTKLTGGAIAVAALWAAGAIYFS